MSILVRDVCIREVSILELSVLERDVCIRAMSVLEDKRCICIGQISVLLNLKSNCLVLFI